MYTVIGNLRSRTMRVLWLLQEMGLEYEHHPIAPHTDAVRAHNPAGKIPVLLDGDHAFTDSVAIMTYLADKHRQFTFPAGTPKRAIQDGHTNFLLDEFDACLWAAGRHARYLPQERRVPAVIDSLKWEFERSREHFVTRLGAGPFLMGDTMTIADIIAAHCGRWAVNAGFPVEQPEFMEYVDRIVARPAFKQALGGS
ncbi:MAG: glutathione S-transferase family protein [Paracoccaceae bacterium]